MLPQLASFESFTMAVLPLKEVLLDSLSHSCAQIDLATKLTSAGKIKIDMTCLGDCDLYSGSIGHWSHS